MKNFGMKSRDMGTAVRLALKIARDKKELSYSSVATLSERWNPFEQFIKTKGIRCLEDVGPDTLICYGQTLAELVKKGEIATATAQTRVSAINTIYCILTEGNWQSISPTHDCGIGKRKFVRSKAPPSEKELQTALADLTNQPLKQCLVLLCFYFGLRSKEASLLRINVALKQAISENQIEISKGTKGGKKRFLPITSAKQIEILQFVSETIGRNLCLVPLDHTYSQWREGIMRSTRDFLKRKIGFGLHDLRAAYACSRYQKLTGSSAPVITGYRTVDKLTDKSAREIISQELGHNRIDVTNAYLGSMR